MRRKNVQSRRDVFRCYNLITDDAANEKYQLQYIFGLKVTDAPVNLVLKNAIIENKKNRPSWTIFFGRKWTSEKIGSPLSGLWKSRHLGEEEIVRLNVSPLLKVESMSTPCFLLAIISPHAIFLSGVNEFEYILRLIHNNHGKDFDCTCVFFFAQVSHFVLSSPATFRNLDANATLRVSFCIYSFRRYK